MARGIEGNEIATPRATLKKTASSQSSKPGPKQQSIAGFFQKRTAPASSAITPAKRRSETEASPDASATPKPATDLAPASSSAGPASSSPQTALGASQQSSVANERNKENGKVPSSTCASARAGD